MLIGCDSNGENQLSIDCEANGKSQQSSNCDVQMAKAIGPSITK